jgi:hypothetical protein
MRGRQGDGSSASNKDSPTESDLCRAILLGKDSRGDCFLTEAASFCVLYFRVVASVHRHAPNIPDLD